MASRAARDMASCMRTGGKAKSKNFMKAAVPPARKGVFAAKAKKAGKTTAAFANDKASAPGTLGKEARLAQTFAKERPKAKAPAAASKPKPFAVGGAAKTRLGMASASGKQTKVTAPVKSQSPAPKRPKMAI